MERQHYEEVILMYVQPFDGQLTPPLSALGGSGEAQSALTLAFPGMLAPDDIARFAPPLTAGSSGAAASQTFSPGQYGSVASNPLASMMAQLMQMLQMMMGSYGSGLGSAASSALGSPYGSASLPGTGCTPAGATCPNYGNEQYFQNASGASQGDPHLSFNGNTWNSMASQPNLLNSDSFQGGFQISTQVTPPNANGITHNQSATVTLNGGATTVAMNDAGQASISQYGQNVPIGAGQTVQLGNGQSVTCNQNGSLTVNAQNGTGGSIATTLTAQDAGVNVEVSAQNVDLGGALVSGQQQTPPGTMPSLPNPLLPLLPANAQLPNPLLQNPLQPLGF
jgi:hypothetical protein